MTVAAKLEPIFKSLTVDRGLGETFDFYANQMGTWWPLRTHSVGQEKAVTVTMEAGVEGRIFETQKDGTEVLWGKILIWDAPNRVVHTWHVGRDVEEGTEVEITFTDIGEGKTRVDLTHRNWENLGEIGPALHDQYDGGWDHVFGECFGGGVAKGS